MYLVKCRYCESTYQTESEGKLICENCGAANELEDIIRKTSGNYFKQAAEQDYAKGEKSKAQKPKSELEKIRTMRSDQKKVRNIMLKMTLVAIVIFLIMLFMISIR